MTVYYYILQSVAQSINSYSTEGPAMWFKYLTFWWSCFFSKDTVLEMKRDRYILHEHGKQLISVRQWGPTDITPGKNGQCRYFLWPNIDRIHGHLAAR